MIYPDVHLAYFIQRPNRFIAHCRLQATGEEVVVHVKNTGRGKEVLLPEALVALQHHDSTTRKTAYDLIAVKKGSQWINIDSQVPNRLAFDGINSGQIHLPGLSGKLVSLKREVVYGHSKFDLAFATDQQEQGFVEVKGMTLESHGIGAFPDAPTLRGQKHVKELLAARKEGYHTYLLFIAQFQQVTKATIHRQMQPSFVEAVEQAMAGGVAVLAYNCQVSANAIAIHQQLPFDTKTSFIDPVIEGGY